MHVGSSKLKTFLSNGNVKSRTEFKLLLHRRQDFSRVLGGCKRIIGIKQVRTFFSAKSSIPALSRTTRNPLKRTNRPSAV